MAAGTVTENDVTGSEAVPLATTSLSMFLNVTPVMAVVPSVVKVNVVCF